MKIGFFGTPDIARHCLEDLFEHHEVLFVVSGEDKPAGRNRKMQCCETKECASCHDIPVLQPEKLNDNEFISALRSYNADIFVVVAFGKIIPREVFTMPLLGTINLHPSLLPKYRGAAPMRWAIIKGEQVTGITVQMINERLDAGDIVLQKEMPLDENVTYGELYEQVLPEGAKLLNEAIDILRTGYENLVTQNENEATYCGKITKEMAKIDWNDEGRNIHNLVRGLNPKPVAWTSFREKKIRIWRTSLLEQEVPSGTLSGTIVRLTKKCLAVAGKDRYIELLELQPEGKKVMDGPSFYNGYRIQENEHFE